jgi:hypothetical protein
MNAASATVAAMTQGFALGFHTAIAWELGAGKSMVVLFDAMPRLLLFRVP